MLAADQPSSMARRWARGNPAFEEAGHGRRCDHSRDYRVARSLGPEAGRPRATRDRGPKRAPQPGQSAVEILQARPGTPGEVDDDVIGQAAPAMWFSRSFDDRDSKIRTGQVESLGFRCRDQWPRRSWITNGTFTKGCLRSRLGGNFQDALHIAP